MLILPPDFSRLLPNSPSRLPPPLQTQHILHPTPGLPCLSASMDFWRGRGLQAVTWPSPASVLASCPQLFLKEHLHQLLEGMREHVLNRAAVTLQRCLRGFFIQRRFRSLRRKIILLQSRARGYLARCGPERAGLPGVQRLGSGKAEPELG